MDLKPIIRRRRFKQALPLRERLLRSANQARERALLLAPGPEREKLLRQARIAETTARFDEWLLSPGMRPPE
jgi:hypothetical protein